MQAVGEIRARRQFVQAGDLVEERPCLEDEQVVLPVADAGEVHRQPARDVRVAWADQDLPVAVYRLRGRAVGDRELRRPGQFEGGRPAFAEHLEAEGVRQAVGDPGDREGADGTAGERRGEGDHVLVLDRLPGLADRDAGGVAHYRPQRDRTVGYQRGQEAAADAVHRTAEELTEVHQVAADV